VDSFHHRLTLESARHDQHGSELLVTNEDNMGLIWEHRLALRLPRPLLFGAFLFAVCFSAAYIGFQWFFGFVIESSAFGMEVFLIVALIAPAYFFGPYEQEQYKTEAPTFYMAGNHIRASRVAGAAGILAFIGLWELIQVSQGREFLSLWSRLHAGTAITAMFLLLGWLVGRNGYFLYAGVWDRPGQQMSDIDLLNLDHIYVIGRSGLEGALVWFIVVAIAGFLILPDVGSALWLVLSIFAINVGIGLMFLLAPARKVRSLIRDVKREELARLKPFLRQARSDTLNNDASSQGRLSDLLAYKTQIESTPEWPFDSSTLLRFALYLLIPIGSMIGGALVERVIDLVLD
jgi:hypothetical protein